MSVETEVTYESPWIPSDEIHPDRITLSEFCEQHGLIPEFLPFEYIKTDIIEDMCNIHDFLETRLVTKQIASTANISESADVNINYYPHTKQFLDATAMIIGWWDAGYSTSYGSYYANPNYTHTHENYLIRPGDRKEFFEDAARLGIDYSTIAPAIGVEEGDRLRKNCSEIAQDAGVEYRPLKREGFYNLVRTWKTINHWGYQYSEISKAFKTPSGTIRGRVIDIAGDFEPPDEPSIARPQ